MDGNQITLDGKALKSEPDYDEVEKMWSKERELFDSPASDYYIHSGLDPREELKYMANKKEAPEHLKDGVLSVAIWTNKSKDGKEWKSFTMQRSYQDKDKKWLNTTSLRSADLLKMAKLFEQAYEKYGSKTTG